MTMTGEIVVRACTALPEFQTCVELQRQIWGESDLEVEPPTMFVVAAHTGGQVLGAFAGGRMAGYLLAVPGTRNGAPYLHSHQLGVAQDFRDRGIGRQLKLFQREEALGRGIRLIEWTFDPFELRNAHFNLNRLGAICRRYEPNLYGVTTSPLHRGLPTDRLLAEWHLDAPRVLAILTGRVKEPDDAPGKVFVPAEVEQWTQENLGIVAREQTRIREEFQTWFRKGYAAVAARKAAAGMDYLLTPWSDF